MDSPPSIDPPLALPPGPEGLAEDLPCPKCQYNLRGLTLPRCPECGFAFDWQNLPQMRAGTEESSWTPGDRIALGFAIAVLLAIAAATPLIGIAVLVVVLLAIAAFQACFEMVFARLILGALSRRLFRAWWEGVLVGYGLCAITCCLVGRSDVYMDLVASSRTGFPLPLLLLITAIESTGVQYWIVRRRSRQWGEPIPARRLAWACLAAKTAAAIPWTLIATGALAR